MLSHLCAEIGSLDHVIVLIVLFPVSSLMLHDSGSLPGRNLILTQWFIFIVLYLRKSSSFSFEGVQTTVCKSYVFKLWPRLL